MAETLVSLKAKLDMMQTTGTAKVMLEKSGAITEIASLELLPQDYGSTGADVYPTIVLHSA